jgi:hypothetical protein
MIIFSLLSTRRMKSLLFFVLFLVIAAVSWKTSVQMDGFQDITPAGASPGLSIPVISPRAQTLIKGEVKPFAEPSTALLAPPPGQTASVNSLPPEDPAMQKANSRRLYSIYESLIGFFKNEAEGLKNMGDSSVTLPMNTARADIGRLRDELGAIDRNPGLESSLTQDDANEIEANLAYLQKKWRLSANAMGAPSPMKPVSEGFSPVQKRGWFNALFGTAQEGFQSDGSVGSVAASGTRSGTSTGCSGSSCKANVDDLMNLSTQITAEIVRLQASGAQDATTQNRMKLLSSILQTVSDLISGLKNFTIKPEDITLTKGQMTAFLKSIKNPNSPLTTLLSDWGLPSGLGNLFPTYAAGDVSGADLAKELFGKYIKDLKNLSWDIGLSYKGQAEQDIAANYASAMKDARYFADTAGTPTASNADNSAPTSAGGVSSGYRGLFDSVITSVTGQKPTTVDVSMGATTGSGHAKNMPHSTTSQPFDWKERAKQICSQIKMRELNPYEFGCLKDENSVRQENFSWRGYAKMVCSRLGTVYDPSIPELCGCPPPSWIGWRP